MNEFKPIAMRCNQQQYNEINQILLDNGCKCGLDDTFDERPYLTNNYNATKNNINNTINSLKDDYNRTVFETWDKDIFLEYCGIEIKNEYKVGDYVITQGYSPSYDGVALKINKITSRNTYYFDNPNYYDWQPTHNFDLKHIVRKATIDEIFNNYSPNNNKNKYIVGKWYDFNNSDFNGKVCAKFSELSFDNKYWHFSEFIGNNQHKICNGNWYANKCTNNLTDLSEIQQYLPNRHPDKIVKQPDLNALLEEAKRRYPIGTKFQPVHVLCGINVVTAEDFHWENDRKDCIIVSSKNLNENWAGAVYKNGKWAEIIEPTKPVETKSKYQIAAEKALERFKDIQIGDEYMTNRNDLEIASRLPEIQEINNNHCFIDCGIGFLWQYSKPDIFGYKINKQNNIKTDAYSLPPNPIIANKQLIEKIQPIQLIKKKKIVMDTKINPIKSINTNLKIKNQKLWN